MQNPVTVITDKVMSMISSMVYLSMRVYHRSGATVTDISAFLNEWVPAGQGVYHEGIVERALHDLSNSGKVVQAGGRWYPAAQPA